jgi:membrane-associated protease RseP (regulator of RpoE activity)
MSGGWKGIAITIAVALALFAGAVLYAVHQAAKPQGYAGLEFAPLTAAAAARTPMLAAGGALVNAVLADSPADRAGIKAGEVVSAMDGEAITTARQASERIKAYRVGSHVALTLYDVTKGDIAPRRVRLVFEAEPVTPKKLSVKPPPTLAEPEFERPKMAANAAWSRRIALGAFIKPLALNGIGAGQCNGFVPDLWSVRGHDADNSMLHVGADKSFMHAIFKSGALNGLAPERFIAAYLDETFRTPTLLTTPQDRPFGFRVVNFGNRKGGAGFVQYRVTGNRIALWIAAYAAGEAASARPIVGAVALSLRCLAPGAPAPMARDAAMPGTAISLRCMAGRCEEGDFAGNYMAVLRKGYVHSRKGEMYLVNPRKDLWQNGAEGPGFYHQVKGENEKLEPGRTN